MEDKLLAVIFFFESEKPLTTPLFSRTTLKEKSITTMYTNAKVDGHTIKFIFNSGLAGSIITQQLMDQLGHQVDHATNARIIMADRATKTSISKIDNFFIEINGIITPIKVLVMEATQYQALVGNDWLIKTNAMLDWNMQELQLSQNSRYMWVPATCRHFKSIITPLAPLIKFEKKKKKPTWKAYQVFWANKNHNELLPILSWDDNRKEKQREKLTWNADQAWKTNNNQDELTTTWK
ncbi:hypothetical protein G9A89_011882 [Geosiphon pyriformis]|nr:hypothetical protein G9A89_011882 [Geosiphon pyriformis]